MQALPAALVASTPGGILLVLALAVPFLGVLAMLVLQGRRAERLALLALGACLAVALAIGGTVLVTRRALVEVVGGWTPPLGLALRADGLSAALLLTTALVVCAVAAFAWLGAGMHSPESGPERRAPAMFWLLLVGLWGSLNAAFLGQDLFNLYVALELLTFAALPLVCLDGRAATLEAALRYLVFALLGSVLYLLGTALLYGAYGTLDIALLRQRVLPNPASLCAAALMTVGLLAKAALFPLHLWLPPAHAGAPAAASALLSALVVKAPIFLVVRLWFDAMPMLLGLAAAQVLGLLGAAAILVGSVLALRQPRLKLVVAYSTVAQIGYLFLVFPLVAGASLTGSQEAWIGGALQLVSHACAKASMFLAAGLIAEALGHDDMTRLGAAARALPMTVLAFGLSGLSLMGLPPSGGFAAKWLLLLAAVGSGQWWWALVLLAGGLLTGGYVFLVLSRAMAGGGEARPVGLLRELVVLALALASVAMGFVPLASFGLLGIGRLPGPGWDRETGAAARPGAAAMSVLLLLMLLLPAGMALACVAPRWRQGMLAWLVVAPLPALAAALLAADAPPLLLPPARAGMHLALDRPGALLLGGAALLWSAAGAYAAAYLRGQARNGPFAVWWLLTLLGNLGVFVAGDLITFYLAFAFVSLAAYGLVAHDATPRAYRAAAIYLVLAVLGEIALLGGFVLLAAAAPDGSLAIGGLVATLPGSPVRGLTLGLLVAGFGLKAGLVPLHVWLPVAHPAAPMPASAVLSGAIVKAGIIGLIRFLPLDGAGGAAGWADAWGQALAAAGLLTAFYGVALGVTQRNPKTVLAYSTVSQMGVAIAVLGTGMQAAAPGTAFLAAYYGLHHLLAKGALFLSVEIAAAWAGRHPWPVLLPVAVVALGMAGLPLTGGALAKLAVKPALGYGPVGVLATLSAAGTALLMLHLMRLLAEVMRAPAPSAPPPAGMLAPWALMLASALLVPWWFYPGPVAEALALPALWDSAWPVLLGAVLFAGLRRRSDRLPAVPEGDVVLLGLQAWGFAARGAGPLVRLEARLREWTMAGIALLAVAAALVATMLAGLPS